MTRPLRQPAPVIDSTPSPSPPPSPSPNPSPSHDPVDMDAEEDIYFQDSPKEAPRISDPQEGETHNFSFTSPSKITSTRDSTDANVFGQPVMGKPTHNSQAKNPDQKAIAAAPARSTAAVTAGLSNPVDVIDLTENDAPPRTPPRPPKTFYPTPDTSIKTKGKAKTPVAVEGEGCDEFDFGLDDKDLLEFAEQVDKCVPARARSQSTDYGSFDEDDTEDLIRITDEAAAKVPLTPTGNKLPASAAQLWTPSKTPTRAPASAPAKREVAGPGPSTRATAKTRAPVVSAARTQFQKPPAFKANKMNKAGHTVIEIDRGLTLGGSSIEG
ncbi:hypothetical protein B0T14DRAFT_560708 [Immersiella caudata]|uniref:Uncharacterized protein n=1 Tax=Immersiella caudata TaxID=314043 RepID=A0AA40CD61_9PEZI|nr:hypothetical protein B0T14DRAFT_560708 [Immersiella caudata]